MKTRRALQGLGSRLCTIETHQLSYEGEWLNSVVSVVCLHGQSVCSVPFPHNESRVVESDDGAYRFLFISLARSAWRGAPPAARRRAPGSVRFPPPDRVRCLFRQKINPTSVFFIFQIADNGELRAGRWERCAPRPLRAPIARVGTPAVFRRKKKRPDTSLQKDFLFYPFRKKKRPDTSLQQDFLFYP